MVIPFEATFTLEDDARIVEARDSVECVPFGCELDGFVDEGTLFDDTASPLREFVSGIMRSMGAGVGGGERNATFLGFWVSDPDMELPVVVFLELLRPFVSGSVRVDEVFEGAPMADVVRSICSSGASPVSCVRDDAVLVRDSGSTSGTRRVDDSMGGRGRAKISGKGLKEGTELGVDVTR